MYARYDYRAGAATANVFADIVKILTGTTDKAQLSADCVQATTEIISVVPAGWTLVDNNTGTANEVVVKAPCAKGVIDKFAKLRVSSSTTMHLQVAESWNASTHVGVNATHSSNIGISVNLANANTFYIAADERFFALIPVVGGAQPETIGAFELKPGVLYDMEGNGMPPVIATRFSSFGASTSNNSAHIPRVKANNGTDSVSTTVNALGFTSVLSLLSGSGNLASGMADFLNADMVTTSPPVAPINAVLVASSTIAFIGEVYGPLVTRFNLGNSQDELDFGGKTYRIACVGTSARILFLKE